MANLSIKVQDFEGPLDLLIHLIEKEKIDIYDIPIALLTEQYMDYLAKFKILSSLLPGRLAYKYQSSVINRYSFFILIALVFTGILGFIIHPISNFIISILNLIISIII